MALLVIAIVIGVTLAAVRHRRRSLVPRELIQPRPLHPQAGRYHQDPRKARRR